MRTAHLVLLVIGLAATACATYREDLNRGQRMYEENQYEHALALWRGLEVDADSLSSSDFARYAYLRGMTDYRLGFRADSRHWLAIAQASEQVHGGGLSVEWKERLEQSLTELNRDVYGGAEHFERSSSSAVEYGRAAPGDESKPTDVGSGTALPATRTGQCTSNADCTGGQICDGKWCSPL